jgi:D-glycero-D-manno-heptose 1,7-bisphosphate phosphatase
MNPSAVFLDRDGVINRDSHDYIRTWSEFAFYPGSLEALRRLHEAGCTVVVVTNQSAIARGITTEAAVEDIHRRLKGCAEAAGGPIADILYCPHGPGHGCTCRKPAPGLIRRACSRHGIDPKTSVLIGDSARDIRSARAAGCGITVLVRTGNGVSAEQELRESGEPPDHVAADLPAAVRWLLRPA